MSSRGLINQLFSFCMNIGVLPTHHKTTTIVTGCKLLHDKSLCMLKRKTRSTVLSSLFIAVTLNRCNRLTDSLPLLQP